MQYHDERRPIGGLNQDDENRVLPPEDYRYALNVRNGSSDSDNIGAIENIKGTTEIVFPLPVGRNICIGQYEDEQSQTVLFFVWNSNAKHSIFRYYDDTRTVELVVESKVLNFRSSSLVSHVNFVEDLLYWTDGSNPPRKINVAKANDTNKNRVFNCYFGLDPQATWSNTTVDYRIRITDPSGAVVKDDSVGIIGGFAEETEEAARKLAFNINNFGFQLFITAEACGKFIECTFTDQYKGKYDAEFYAVNHDVIAVPQNYYRDIVEHTIDRVKWPQRCEPTGTIQTDTSRNTNYLTNKTFQFRTRLVYDDHEKTVLGPISKVVYNNLACETIDGSSSNCIRVDFTDSLINDILNLQLIRRIDVLMRESEIGVWKLVESIDQCEFGVGTNYYDFYNDRAYDAVDDQTANKLQDSVPLVCKTQGMAKGRLFDGNLLEGYDPVCVDADIDIDYQDIGGTEEKRYTVSGVIFIRNFFTGTNPNFGRYQPIHSPGGGTPRFGGFNNALNGWVNTDKYQQEIPLGGFVPYLAGTDLYTISVQQPGNNTGLQNSQGVYTHNSNADRNKIRDEITQPGGDLVNLWGQASDSRMYSKFFITGVPEGKYLLRVAGHETTLESIENGDYQRSSTNVTQIYQKGNFVQYQQELLITVSGGDVDDIIIEIGDLSNPTLGAGAKAKTGYVTGGTRTISGTPTPAELLIDERITKSKVVMDTSSSVNSRWAQGITYTDHNGYFFFTENAFFNGKLQVNDVFCADQNLNETQYNFADGSIHSPVSGSLGEKIIMRNNNPTIISDRRSFVDGIIQDKIALTPIQKVSVTPTEGEVSSADQNGRFSAVVYADTITFDISGQIRRDGSIVYNSQDSLCGASFDFVDVFNGLIGPNDKNQNEHFDLGTVLGSAAGAISINALKRGWDGRFGIVYYDRALRQNTVQTNDKLEKHVLFYTEVDPRIGVQPALGPPKLNWSVKHLPPEWATHWQWVRTKNRISEYIQWTADQVTYLNDDDQPGTFSSGTKVQISLQGIAEYLIKHPNSVKAVAPQKGWKMRLIKDNNGNLYTDYFEFDVISAGPSSFDIYKDSAAGELKPGFLFELYNPVLEEENEVFYEIGECYEVGTDASGKPFHKGELQDQDPNNPVNTPATGCITCGDAYYRTRNFVTTAGSAVTPFYIDDAFISDFYDSKHQSIGRPSAVNPDFRQVWRPNTFRFGGKIFPATKINNLSSFDADDASTTDQEYGPINAMAKAENVLLLIHTSRWVTVYVEEALLRKQDGTNEIIASDDVIGGIRALKGKYGTVHPESVMEYKGAVYAYDMNKGEYVRYALNGLTSLSDVKMSNYWSDKSKELILLQDQYKVPVLSQYDPFNDEVIVTIRDVLGYVDDKGEAVKFETGDKSTTSGEFTGFSPINSDPPQGNTVVTPPNSSANSGFNQSGPTQSFVSFKNPFIIHNDGNGTMSFNGAFVSNGGAVYLTPTGSPGIVIIDRSSLNNGYLKLTGTLSFTIHNDPAATERIDVKVLDENGELQPLAAIQPNQAREITITENTGSQVITDPLAQPTFEQNEQGVQLEPKELIKLYEGETIAYSERLARWVTFYSFNPEMMGRVGIKLISWIDGRLFIHNDSDTRNNFYGVQYSSQYRPVSNVEPKKKKVFHAVHVQATKAWFVPVAKTPNGMETEIQLERFVEREGFFYSHIPKDKNDPSITDPALAAINGRPLRDTSLEITFQNDDTEEVILYATDIISSPSERSGQ